MKIRFPTLVVLFSLPFGGCGGAVASPGSELRASSALFREFETVVYAKASLFPGIGEHKGLSGWAANNLLDPFNYLKAGLRQLGTDMPSEVLRNGDSVFLGAKEFSPPDGLGPVHSRRCYVVVLSGDHDVDLRRHFRASSVASFAGQPVWTWTANLGELGENNPRASTLYAAQVGRSYVLVSNDLAEIQTVGEYLTSAAAGAEGLSGIRDWEFVRRHDMWAYRRCRFAGVVDTSAVGLGDFTPAALAVAFWIEPGRKSGTLRLFTSPGDASAAVRFNEKMRQPGALLSPLAPAGPNLWEVSVSIAEGRRSGEELFEVTGLFGFATYL